MKQIIIVNEYGFAGEERINYELKTDLNNSHELTKKTLEENPEAKIYFRPHYEEINKTFNTLKNNPFIIILTPEQEKEKKLLETYFKITKLDTILIPESAKKMLKIDFNDTELLQLSKRSVGYKSLFCILHTEGLNYSYLKNNFRHDRTIKIYSAKDFNKLSKDSYSKKYLEKEGNADPIFYEILFSELTGEETIFVKIYKKILTDNQKFNDEEKKAIEKLRKKYWIAELEENKQKKLIFGYPIRDEDEIKEWKRK